MKASRRAFLQVMAASGGALVIGIDLARADDDAPDLGFRPSAWLRIEPDGTVVAKVGKSEMGQGVRTALPMILAEELDADFSKIRIEQASPGPDFRALGTGGSGSIMRSWDALRTAGAAAREMLVAAAAAGWQADAETLVARDGVITDPASGRRASYGSLLRSAAALPVPQEPRLKASSEFRLLGTSPKRLDGPDIVSGRARYGVDVRPEGLLFAVVARAPRLGAELMSFDTEAAERVSGVVEIVRIPTGVAVVATNSWAALQGREKLTTEWSAGPNSSFDTAVHLEKLIEAVKNPGITIRKDGAGREGIAAAARRLDATYLYPFAAHASVEPVNSTVLVEDDHATVWSPTQTPNGVQAAAAQLLGIPPESVTVHVELMGGGFGRRLGVDFDREAVEIARRIPGRPVQSFWTRADDMRHGYFQAASAHRLLAGLDAEGNLIAWEHRKASTMHNARSTPSAEDKLNPERVRGSAWGVYDSPWLIPHAEMTYVNVDAPVPIGPWRSVFSPSSVFARESFIDEIALAVGKDPLQFRLELLGGPDDENAIYEIGSSRIDRRRMRRVLELLAEKSGWDAPTPKGFARGIAANVFHTETYIAYAVDVRLRPDASTGQLPFFVDRVVCAIDCGVVVHPAGVRQQVESGVIWSLSNMKNEITAKNGSIEQSNYHDFPVLMIDETPRAIETHLVASDDPRPHGIGEPVVCPLAPAVANAVSRLTGRRIRRLPVRVSDLA